MQDLVLDLQLTVAVPGFIFQIPMGLTKVKRSQQLRLILKELRHRNEKVCEKETKRSS